jgi:hypothetical protein
MTVEVGGQYRFAYTVKDSTGALISPATNVVTIVLPDQTTATPSIVTDSLGTFHVDYTMVQEGLHSFTGVTTGPVTHRTDYASAVIFRSIVGIDEARAYIGETDTSRDDILRQLMMALTEKIESVVGVCVIRTFTNQTVNGYDREVIRLRHAPLPSTTSVASIVSVYPGGPSWATGDLIVYPESGTVEPVNMIPFWWGPWKATYTAGRTVVSQPIQLALKEAIFEFWSTQRPYGPNQLAPGMDDTSRWETALAAYDLPPHARSLLEPYEIPGFA